MENLIIIAHIHTDLKEKFGIPRQSGLVPELLGEIVFTPEFRSPEALLGIEEYSHLWLLWDFSQSHRDTWSPTVRPPRLGGQVSRGVFATRSPFRPNSIGLSCVKLEEVRQDTPEGPVLVVSGVDMLDGTPIYDIKPYVPYADAHPDASGSFGEAHKKDQIPVDFPEFLLSRLPEDKRQAAISLLSQDPRAAYNKKPGYVYGMAFAGFDIRFLAEENRLTVVDVVKNNTLDNQKVK